MSAKAVNISYVSKTHGTNVMPFIIDAYVSLREAGNIEANDCPASGAEEAFFIANNRKKVVAVLSFFKSGENSVTIDMGYVHKDYRKRGYYRALWERLVKECEERSIKTIIGYHKSTNDAILTFNERVGRRIKYICSEYKVTE